MTAGDIRPGARGGRAARRANLREREQERLEAHSVISNRATRSEIAQAEAITCPICNQAVHPTNWSAHMTIKHPDENKPLHEAEPGWMPLTAIRIDGGTQPRAQTEEAVIGDYAEAMKEGVQFPKVIVFYDGAAYWLADGFHRVEAAKRVGHTDIAAEVRQGTQRDAILFSVGANADHGLRRTNADKQRVVQRLLSDDEWAAWSNREIARRCAVSEGLVRSLRTERSDGDQIRTYTTKHGTTATMQTGNIGKSTPPVTYGKKEDDYQPDVPEIHIDEIEPKETWEEARLKPPENSRYSENETEWRLGGRGATVQARSGQSGILAFVVGRDAYVDTQNGRRKYDALYLRKVDDPIIDQEDGEPETTETSTLYPVTPSDDPLVEQARQYALRLIGDSKLQLEDRIKGNQGGSGGLYSYNFGGGQVYLNYFKPNKSVHNFARNQIALCIGDPGDERLFRFNAFKLLEWKLANPPAPAAQIADQLKEATWDINGDGRAKQTFDDLVERAESLGDDATLIEGVNYKRDSRITRAATPNESQPFDRMQTPPYALDPLLQYLGWSLPSTIWEPACGEGLIVEALFDAGWTEEHVIASDILTGQSFFDYQPDKWEVIVTNPPYSLKIEWIERCYALGKPFALLLPIDALGLTTVYPLMQEKGFEIMFLDNRVDFKMPNKGWDSHAQFSTFWLCHDLLPEKVMFGSIKAAKKAFKAEIGDTSDDDPE